MAGPSGPPAPGKPLRWAVFWVAVIGGLGVFDGWRATKRDGSTLSEVTREVFRVDTPHGRAVFAALFWAGAETLAAHICKQQLDT